MSQPWFRSYARFSYRPITWQGRALLAAMAVATVALGLVFLLNDDRPLLAWSAAGAAAFVMLAGHTVIGLKIERDYRQH